MATVPITFKVASEEWEIEQIHRLNYKTFVVEIPQHRPNALGILVDKFHDENTYLICLRDRLLVGMLAVRDRRPFSLDTKLKNLETYLPPHRSICELRLLAVEKDHRSPPVFQGIMLFAADYVENHGFDLAIVSGTLKQLKLYKQMGFVPFGPLVGTSAAQFQPMYLTIEEYRALQQRSRAFRQADESSATVAPPINLLPGPVAISKPVRRTQSELPMSHRSRAFMRTLNHTKRLLCRLVGSRFVELFAGSGTLANDLIAGQVSLLRRPGLVLTNGEFGDRLIDHATRFRLSFQIHQAEWGTPFEAEAIRRALHANPDVGWLWAAHCETSSGILNDLSLLRELAAERDLRLCLDCISSIGTVPVDLSDVYLASGVSGKGLGAFTGLSMVFYNHQVAAAPTELPRYLDLGLYAACHGVPFSISSNLVSALHTALTRVDATRFGEINALSAWLRSRLIESGLQLVSPAEHAAPAVITIAVPPPARSERVGDQLQQSGYLLSYRSEYLLARNWIQICLMGECDRETLAPLIELLAGCCVPRFPVAAGRID